MAAPAPPNSPAIEVYATRVQPRQRLPLAPAAHLEKSPAASRRATRPKFETHALRAGLRAVGPPCPQGAESSDRLATTHRRLTQKTRPSWSRVPQSPTE